VTDDSDLLYDDDDEEDEHNPKKSSKFGKGKDPELGGSPETIKQSNKTRRNMKKCINKRNCIFFLLVTLVAIGVALGLVFGYFGFENIFQLQGKEVVEDSSSASSSAAAPDTAEDEETLSPQSGNNATIVNSATSSPNADEEMTFFIAMNGTDSDSQTNKTSSNSTTTSVSNITNSGSESSHTSTNSSAPSGTNGTNSDSETNETSSSTPVANNTTGAPEIKNTTAAPVPVAARPIVNNATTNGTAAEDEKEEGATSQPKEDSKNQEDAKDGMETDGSQSGLNNNQTNNTSVVTGKTSPPSVPTNMEWPQLVGETGEEAKQVLETMYGVDAFDIYILHENDPVTKDYRFDRIRLFTDDDGIVVQSPRIG
jgi:hypothetical protein